MAEADDQSWNDTHRAFLQCLLSRQTITFSEGQALLAAIQTAHTPDRPTLMGDITEADFQSYIHIVSTTISRFDLEIRSAVHQVTNTRVYALVNSTSDNLTQMATFYSADEISFIRRVLEAIFDTFNTREAEIMALTTMQAVRLARTPRENRRESSNSTSNGSTSGNLSGAQAEKLLDTLTLQGWFEHNRRTGFYTLAPRALMELKDWLVQTFNRDEDEKAEDEDDDDWERIKTCGGCTDIVTVGVRCPNLECLLRLHGRCIKNYFRSHGNRSECPMCKTAWQNPGPVGEKAARHQYLPRERNERSSNVRRGRS